MPRQTAGAGFIRTPLNVRYPLPTGTGAHEEITDAVLGYGFSVEKVEAFVTVAGTGAGATRTMRILKGAATVVATATVTLAGTATVGAKVAFTVTEGNEFLDTDNLTVDIASGGTAFTAGELQIVATLRQRLQQR
jgi:hypothetical protein